MKESYLDDTGDLKGDIGLDSSLFRKRFPGKGIVYLGRRYGPYWVRGTVEYLEELAAKYPGGSLLFHKEFDGYAFKSYERDSKLKIQVRKRYYHVIGEPEFLDELLVKWNRRKETCLSLIRLFDDS